MSKQEVKLTLAHYEEIVRAVPQLFYVIDGSGTLLAASALLLKFFDISTASELTGLVYERFITHLHWLEARVQFLKQADLEVINTGKAQYEVLEPPVTDARGLTFYYESTRVPLLGDAGKVSGLIVSLIDVTKQKMLEEKFQPPTDENAKKREANIGPYPPGVHRDPSKPPKILVIEDNPIAQHATKSILIDLDCQVDLASSDQEAEQLFQVGKYDVILMDIGLEGTSGYMVAKKIRKLEENTGYRVPIIALTGFDADVVKTDCDYYFMEGAITKPLNVEQARQIILKYVYQGPVEIPGLKSLKYEKKK